MAQHRVSTRAGFFACAALWAFCGPAVLAQQSALSDIFLRTDSKPESKKGLQVQMVDDALALGVHHAAINVNLLQLAGSGGSSENEALELDGETYPFNRRYAESLDSKINPLSAQGVIVYLIILAYKSSNAELARVFLHPNFNPSSKAPIAAFNTYDPVGAANLKACLTFLARRYAKAGVPPVHFIIGNEVNSHWFWYNMGEAGMDAVADAYERAVRICHDAVHAVSADSRVYLSFDQHWNASATPKEPLKSSGTHAFLEAFSTLAKQRGDFAWHVAFHPYPENLFEPRTWNDKHVTMDFDTPKITFKNIEVLESFMKRPDMQFEGKPRRIILSEQGFHTTRAPDGELIQAAAYAYAYRKVEKLDGIDAFILHRHVDHSQEGGLHLGLWTGDSSNKPLKKKLIYDVFRLADTREWQDAFKFALPVIGVKDWSEIK